jgi:hypothetical protein
MNSEVITTAGNYWHSGSESDGSLDSDSNCEGWTQDGASYRGQYGQIDKTDVNWITLEGVGAICGQDEYRGLCLGW